MKRLLALMLALVMVMALAACSKDGGETPDSKEPDTTASTAAKLEEKAIVEDLEGVGPVKLSNSYMELTIPEGYGYYVDDANQEAGEDQFQLILELKNADGNDIGELLINNRGGLESADEYAQSTIDEYKDNDSVTVSDVDSAKYSVFDVRHFTLDRGFMVDNRYFGYYKIPDETKEYRNVRFELEIAGYYYKDVEFPEADFIEIMNSIVIK